jgi:hypothetical protein
MSFLSKNKQFGVIKTIDSKQVKYCFALTLRKLLIKKKVQELFKNSFKIPILLKNFL